MTVNSRITHAYSGAPSVVSPPNGVSTPPTVLVALTDGNGNLIAASDNGDGTASLSTSGGGSSPTLGQATMAASAPVVIASDQSAVPVKAAVGIPSVPLTGSNQQVSTVPKTYFGFSMYETSGTATAKVLIYDNTSATGTLLDPVTLAPGESRGEHYPLGLQAATGIYVQVVSGSIGGSVRAA